MSQIMACQHSDLFNGGWFCVFLWGDGCFLCGLCEVYTHVRRWTDMYACGAPPRCVNAHPVTDANCIYFEQASRRWHRGRFQPCVGKARLRRLVYEGWVDGLIEDRWCGKRPYPNPTRL